MFWRARGDVLLWNHRRDLSHKVKGESKTKMSESVDVKIHAGTVEGNGG